MDKVENKNANQINFDYNGKHYCLEYTRESVKQMEAAGFNMNDMGDKPATRIEQLWQGAFLANHSSVKRDKIDKIYRMMGDKTKLIGALTEMYNEPIEALLAEPEDGKNLKWIPSWESEDEE